MHASTIAVFIWLIASGRKLRRRAICSAVAASQQFVIGAHRQDENVFVVCSCRRFVRLRRAVTKAIKLRRGSRNTHHAASASRLLQLRNLHWLSAIIEHERNQIASPILQPSAPVLNSIGVGFKFALNLCCQPDDFIFSCVSGRQRHARQHSFLRQIG